MTESNVLFEVSQGVATLTLNDAARLNPLTTELLRDSMAALQRVHEERDIRVLVLTAKGRGFCVGADLTALGAVGHGAATAAAGAATDVGAKLSEIHAPATGLATAVGDLMEQGGNPFVTALRELPVPVLCAINGVLAGGGVGVALAADVTIAARSAYFYLPFVPALGLVPDMGSAWFLQRAVGRSRALALSLLGERLSAEQAMQWGLIWSCVDDAELAAETQRIATRLAALPAHSALETRALFDHAEAARLPEQLRYEAERQRELITGPAFAEGLAAFAAKRKPMFNSR